MNDIILDRKDMIMVELRPDQLQPGMRLAQDIMHSEEVYLLRCGVMLTTRMLDRLANEYDLSNREPWVRVYLPKSLAGSFS